MTTTTASVGITEGAGKSAATYSITEDAITKQIQRSTLNDTDGTILNVGGKTASVLVTPTVTAANAYGTNDVVGGLLTFSNILGSAGSGILQGVRVTFKQVQTVGFTLFIFNANPSTSTFSDHTAAAIAAADAAKVMIAIPLNGNSQLGANHTIASVDGIGKAIVVGATTLYGVLVSNSTLTNNFTGASDVSVEVTVLQDTH